MVFQEKRWPNRSRIPCPVLCPLRSSTLITEPLWLYSTPVTEGLNRVEFPSILCLHRFRFASERDMGISLNLRRLRPLCSSSCSIACVPSGLRVVASKQRKPVVGEVDTVRSASTGLERTQVYLTPFNTVRYVLAFWNRRVRRIWG